LVYPGEEREAAEKVRKKHKKKGKTRNLGVRTALPPPERAADLLRDQHRRPKGTQRFVWTLEQEHDRDAFLREELSDEAWRSLCVECKA
jgi:hypothetical protein